jgi:acyl-CoA synthetase (AMP-forming)/AMP-acid ligase II
MAASAAGSLTDRILARCDEQPERVCMVLVGGDGSHTVLTARALADRLTAHGDALRRRGAECGDIVLLTLDHGADLITLFLGAIHIGAVPCIFPSLTPKLDAAAYRQRLANVVEQIAPAMIVAPPGGPAAGAGAPLGVDVVDSTSLVAGGDRSDAPGRGAAHGHDRAFIQLSSGSTGRQKAVPVTHAAVLNLVAARNDALQLTSRDVIVGWVPLYHDLGIVGGVLLPLLSGVTSVAISTFYWLTRPVALLEAVHRYHATVCTMPNFAFTYCARRIQDAQMNGLDLAHWRVLHNAAEPIRPDSFTVFFERFARWGFRSDAFISGYGLAENTLSVTMSRLGRLPRTDWIDRATLNERQQASPRAEDDEGMPVVSCGAPLSNVTLQIRSPTGERLPDRMVGDIVISSNCLFDGYVGDRDATADSLRDGWLYTGDLGYTLDGELYVCGRKKDLIVVGGANVHAEDVERSVSHVSGFRSGRIVAFGVPDDQRGSEKIVVVGELSDQIGRRPADVERDVRLRVKQELDVALAHVEFVPAGWIAKTTSGKIARWENRLKWLDARVSTS